MCVDADRTDIGAEPGAGGGCAELSAALGIEVLCCPACHRRSGKTDAGLDEILHDRRSYFVCCEVAQRFWGKSTINP